jgi:methylmalonyl-CoA mutase C-terminal domain/subunit
MVKNSKIKVLLAKTSLDGHNRGIMVIAKWLSDVGMEVIYLGSFQTEEAVAMAAVDEDVDVIGLSFLGGEHLFSVEDMRNQMDQHGLTDDTLFIVGGVIPKNDVEKLNAMGVDRVFLPGTPMEEIVSFITSNVKQRA